jgi:hypothetical protein
MEFNIDREPALNAIASELWSEDHLKIVMTPPEAHAHHIRNTLWPLASENLARFQGLPSRALPSTSSHF